MYILPKSPWHNKSNIASIYKITNLLNGKSYIGFDSDYPSRMNAHIKAAVKGIAHPLYDDMRYYGSQTALTSVFTFELIYQSKDIIHCLKVMENYFIENYNSHYKYGNGYNQSYGGEGHLTDRMIKSTLAYRERQLKKIRRNRSPKHARRVAVWRLKQLAELSAQI